MLTTFVRFTALTVLAFMIAACGHGTDDNSDRLRTTERQMVETGLVPTEASLIYLHLEHPSDALGGIADMVGHGTDIVPIEVQSRHTRSFCFDSTPGPIGLATLKDPSGQTIMTLDAADTCKSVLLEAGIYELTLAHDGQSEAGAVFIKPVERDAAARGSAQDYTTLLSGWSCENCDLSNLDVSGLDLSKRYFKGANFSGSNLENTDLRGCNLANVNFTNAKMNNVKMGKNCTQGTNFAGAIMNDLPCPANSQGQCIQDESRVIITNPHTVRYGALHFDCGVSSFRCRDYRPAAAFRTVIPFGSDTPQVISLPKECQPPVFVNDELSLWGPLDSLGSTSFFDMSLLSRATMAGVFAYYWLCRAEYDDFIVADEQKWLCY